MNAMTGILTGKPWYREPWPWLLMAGPMIVVVAGFFTLWLAVKSDDGLVADDYYKRGLAINQVLSRALRAKQLGLSGRAGFTEEIARVELSGRGVLPGELQLRLVHPTRSLSDQVVELYALTPGVYEGRLAAPMAGRRVVMLEDTARTWRLAGKVAGGSDFAALSPQ